MNLIIINQILILAILVLVGVAAARMKMLTPEVNSSVSKLVFNITLPVFILISISSLKMSPEIVSNSIMVFIFTFVGIFTLYAMALLSARYFKLDDAAKTVHVVHTMFGNTIFLGYPLMKSLYGEEGLLYAIIFQLASDTIMWTFGVYLLNTKESTSKWKNLKPLVNPCTIAFAIGFLLMSFKIQLPYFITSSMGSLGNTTIPLSMLYIGGMLAFINFKDILKHPYVFGMSINKMLLSPALIFMLFFFINKYMQFKISFTALSVIIMQIATPGMATIVILCQRYGRDDTHATENVFVSTVLSILTLPLIYFFITVIYKHS